MGAAMTEGQVKQLAVVPGSWPAKPAAVTSSLGRAASQASTAPPHMEGIGTVGGNTHWWPLQARWDSLLRMGEDWRSREAGPM